MKFKKLKKTLVLGLCSLVLAGTMLTGCGSKDATATSATNATSKEYHNLFHRPYAKPYIVNIEANETAILIDLKDNANQEVLNSEQNMSKAMITSKEVTIPQEWVKTGIGHGTGYWKATQKVVKVSRAVVTREWNQSVDSGTSNRDQAIYAESKESIGFSQGMNIAAQLDTPSDAIKFMYCYNTKSLADVLDSEIRARVETIFNELCSKRKMEEIISDKESIMTQLREQVIPYFADRGITITTLGYKEGIEYEDKAIQEAINAQVTSEKAKVTAENNAEKKKIEAQGEADAAKIKADSDAQVKKIEANAEAEANKKVAESLTPEIIEAKKIEATEKIWEGKEFPDTIVGSDAMTILGLDALNN